MWGETFLRKKSQQIFHTIDVPHHLADITDIDEKNEVDAGEADSTTAM